MTPEQTFPRGHLRVVCPHDFFAGKCGQKRKHLRNSKPYFQYFSIFCNIFPSFSLSNTLTDGSLARDVTFLTEAHLGGSTTLRFADPLVGLRSSRSRMVEELQCTKNNGVWLCRFQKMGPSKFWSSFLEYTMNSWYIVIYCYIFMVNAQHIKKHRDFHRRLWTSMYASGWLRWRRKHLFRGAGIGVASDEPWMVGRRLVECQDGPFFSPVFMVFMAFFNNRSSKSAENHIS